MYEVIGYLFDNTITMYFNVPESTLKYSSNITAVLH